MNKLCTLTLLDIRYREWVDTFFYGDLKPLGLDRKWMYCLCERCTNKSVVREETSKRTSTSIWFWSWLQLFELPWGMGGWWQIAG